MSSLERIDAHYRIPWVTDDLIDYGDVQIELCLPPVLQQRRTVGNRFVLGKNRRLVEAHLAQLGGRPVERIVDVGVLQGGSVVLYHKLFSPKKLIGIELSPIRLPSLDAYAARQRDGSIFVAHGVNQADGPALDRICAAELGGQALDLVVDDASHFNAETRATFRALFPRLRPGGLYVIEDWGWAHWPGDLWQKERGGPYFHRKEPLTNLLIELVALCASSPLVTPRISVESAQIYVERGPAALAPGFELSDHYYTRGEPIPAFGDRASGRAVIYSSPTYSIR